MATKIKEYIKEKRDTLSPSSITTYASILKNLYKRVFKDEEYDMKKFDSPENTLEFLKDSPPNKRKTILSALVIITNEKKYRELMMEDVKAYTHDISKQEKTPAQEASWLEQDTIKEKYNELKSTADFLYKKKTMSPADLQQIQNFIMLSVLGGMFIPPRRSLDYTLFKIKDINKEKDNYFDKNKLVFNTFKTAKTYGKQEVEIPKPLQLIIKKWIAINPTSFLLYDNNMNALTPVKLNQRLCKILGANRSVNALRHSYLTDKYAEHSKVEKALANDMTEMGSSTGMAKSYIKLD
jgi:uncharacterized protein YfkK (UPF0435 family)